MDITKLNNNTSKDLFPTVIEYQPYSICNANCSYCPVGSLSRVKKQKGKEISKEVFKMIIEQTKGRLLERISPHLNCEPLLCKNLPNQIRQWKESHPEAKVEFSTNAVFLTEKYYGQLVESGLDEMYIHFMGISKEYHEGAMQTNYDRVKKNIELVLNFKKQHNDSLKLSIFSHRLRGASLRQWYEFAQEWREKGLNVTLGPLWNRAGNCGEKFEEKSMGLRNNHDSPCAKPFRQIAIECDGNVILCSLDYDYKNKFGNIVEQTIEDIWNGELMCHYRKGHNSKSLKELHLCKDCIRGGCYLLDESILTKIVNYEIPEGSSKEAMLNKIDALDLF
jgi:radical SAM protein with 4Fe4S-binding SPASM domain